MVWNAGIKIHPLLLPSGIDFKESYIISQSIQITQSRSNFRPNLQPTMDESKKC